MTLGSCGVFLISWAQTELNELEAAPVRDLCVGSAWSWRGDPVVVPPLLQACQGSGETRRRLTAQAVSGLVNRALGEEGAPCTAPVSTQVDSFFLLSDGAKTYTATVINVGRGAQPLLMFIDALPPRQSDLWVVHHTLGASLRSDNGPDGSGVICFTLGTRVATPHGPKPVETLMPGDQVLTMDNGPQPIEWIGQRRMTGARLFAMPRLRPIRIAAGALGIERPDQPLLVSPEHKLVVSGAVARALFDTPEVLVAAKDLVDARSITVAREVREVTYIHLLLPQHNIVWANGIASESFHPANTALSSLEPQDRTRLLAQYPTLTFDPHTYGGFARRNLSQAEAAALSQAA